MGDFLLFSHGDVINYLPYEPLLFSLRAGELTSRCAEPEPQRLFAVCDRTFDGEGLCASGPAPHRWGRAGCTWCVHKPFQSS